MSDDKILVIGSINIDMILKVARMPEAGETLLTDGLVTNPGGKGANQAVGVSKLGGNSFFIGKVGDDENGRWLKKQLDVNGVDVNRVSIEKGVNTGTAIILLEDNSENRIVAVNGANAHLMTEDVKKYLDQDNSYQVILIQLEIPLETVEFIIRYASSLNIPVIVDAGPPRECDISIFNKVEILSPNQTELYNMTGIKPDSGEKARYACEKLRTETGANYIILKMGKEGSLLYDGEDFDYFPAYQVEAKDTTAAGDAFSAALAVGYSKKWPIDKIIRYANIVGALTVTRKGAYISIPTADRVEKFIAKRDIKGV